MIVVAETNFILEYVLQQEQSAACEELVRLAADEAPRVTLVIPVFAFAEAGMVLERRTAERREFVKSVSTHMREIGRSAVLRRFHDSMRSVQSEMLRAERDETSRWSEFRWNHADDIDIIHLDRDVFNHALSLELEATIRGRAAALIFASVLQYLDRTRKNLPDRPACFVSRDEDAFQTDPCLALLRERRCKYLNSFDAAVAYVSRSM